MNSINIKKPQLPLSAKPLPTVEEKSTKNIPPKDSNQTISNTDGEKKRFLLKLLNRFIFFTDSSLSKPRPLVKTKLEPDIKPSIQAISNPIPKKKEAVPSPSKPNTQIPLKKPQHTFKQ